MRITTGNWLYNAGIVGFLRILQEAGIEISDLIKQGYFELTSDMLTNFEKAYLKYVIKYGISPFSLIYKHNNKGKREQFKDLSGFFDSNEDFRNRIQEYNRKLLEEILPLDEYKDIDIKIENLIVSYLDNIAEQLRNRKNELSKLQEATTDKEELKKVKLKIKKIEKVEINQLKEATKEAAKDLYFLYVYLQPFYKNRKILGQANYTEAENRIDAFRIVYVEQAKQAIDNKITDGIICRFCNQNKISNELKEDDKSSILFNETFFSVTGVSINDFSNFFYNGLPDLFMCDVCKLIFLCSFAGLNKKPYQLANADGTEGIFVNMPSLELLVKENDALKSFYESFTLNVRDSIYERVIKDLLLLKEKRKKSKWVLQNVFFVELKTSARKDTGKPVFKYFHMGKDIAELFSYEKVIDCLRNVKGILILQKKVKGPLNFQMDIWVDVKSEAVKRLLENESLYPLVYKNIRGILDNGEGNPYNSFALAFVQAAKRQINIYYSKGGDLMEPKQVYGILRHQFFAKGEEDFADIPFEKKERLSYRMLSLIRMGKYAEFYEAIMKLYINAGKPIREELLGLLNTKDTIDFEAKAYAFMTGFLQNPKRSENVPSTTLKEGTKDE